MKYYLLLFVLVLSGCSNQHILTADEQRKIINDCHKNGLAISYISSAFDYDAPIKMWCVPRKQDLN